MSTIIAVGATMYSSAGGGASVVPSNARITVTSVVRITAAGVTRITA